MGARNVRGGGSDWGLVSEIMAEDRGNRGCGIPKGLYLRVR